MAFAECEIATSTKSAPVASKAPKTNSKKKAKKGGDSKAGASVPRKREADFDGSDDEDGTTPVKKEARLEIDEESLPPNDVLNRILDSRGSHLR